MLPTVTGTALLLLQQAMDYDRKYDSDGDSDGGDRGRPEVKLDKEEPYAVPLRNAPVGYTPLEQMNSLKKSMEDGRKALGKQGQALGLQDTEAFRDLNALSGKLRFGATPNDLSVPLTQLQEDLNTVTRAQQAVTTQLKALKDQHMGAPEENHLQSAVTLSQLLDRVPSVGLDTSGQGYTDRSFMVAAAEDLMERQMQRMKDLMEQRDIDLKRPADAPPPGPVPEPKTPLARQLWFLMTDREKRVVSDFEQQMLFSTTEFNLLGFGLVGTRLNHRPWNDSEAVRILVTHLRTVFDLITSIFDAVGHGTKFQEYVQPFANMDEWVQLLDTRGGLYQDPGNVITHVLHPCFRTKGWRTLKVAMNLVYNRDNPPHIRALSLGQLLSDASHSAQISNYLMSYQANDAADSGTTYIPVSIRREHVQRMNAAVLYFQRHKPGHAKERSTVQAPPLVNFF